MLVTIMCDASFCHDTKAGGFGYWIASGRGKKGGGGSFKIDCDNSENAETLAIVNSLYIACNEQLVQEGDRVLIQSDCTGAIRWFEGKGISANRQKVRALELFNNKVDELKLHVLFRHVKGHSKKKDARSRSNNHCDKRAYKAMCKARERKQCQLNSST